MIEQLYPPFQKWSQKGTVWVYSDPHFGAEETINYPSDKIQIALINAAVGKNDTLIILGDVGDINCVRSLRGYKVLVMGNHDAGRGNYIRQIKTRWFEVEKFTQKQIIDILSTEYPNCHYKITQERIPVYWKVEVDNLLFDEVYDGPVMISDKVILSHEPLNLSWAFNIHGHNHNYTTIAVNNSFNVCANVVNYKPLNLNQFYKQGYTKNIESLHRQTINKATINKKYKD